MPAAWIAGGSALLGAGASIFGGQSAADAQVEAAKLGIKEQKREFDYQTGTFKPFLQTGTQANSLMADLYGFNGPEAQQRAYAQYSASPGFDQATQGGLDDVSARFAASPAGYGGGGVQKALLDYGQRSRLGDYYAWRQGVAGQQGVGLDAAARTGQAAQHYGDAASGLYGEMGAARAGGALATATGINGAISNGLSLYGYLNKTPGGASSVGAGNNPFSLYNPG